MTSWSCKSGPWSLAILSRSWIAKLGLSPTLFSEKFLKARSLHLAQERPQQVPKLPSRERPYPERIQFLISKNLCFGYLSDQHVSRNCPQRKTCKIANCTRKHPSVLHTRPREGSTTEVGVGTDEGIGSQVRCNMVNTDTNAPSHHLGRYRTGLAVIPVKVKAKDSDKTVITYAFLDNGSNSSFCTESLMKQHGVKGQKTKISLSTLERKNCTTDSTLVRDLLVSDLDENEYVSLPMLYTRPEIPVSSDDIPTQEDIYKASSSLVFMLKWAF